MHVQYTCSRIRALTVNDHSFDVEQATAETTFEKKARHNGTNSQLNDQVCCPFTKLEMRRMLEVAYGMIRKYHFGYEIRNAFFYLVCGTCRRFSTSSSTNPRKDNYSKIRTRPDNGGGGSLSCLLFLFFRSSSAQMLHHHHARNECCLHRDEPCGCIYRASSD